MNRIRIFLADDHGLLRLGLATLIDFHDDLEIVGDAENGEEAVERVCRLKPDVVVMDLMMPVLDGVGATQRIKERLPETRVLILTSFGTSADVLRAVRAGASGALVKDTPNDKLLAALRKVIAGQRVIPPEMQRQINEVIAFASLSDRQLAFLELAARGFSNEDIVRQHKTTIDAVKKQFSDIFIRLGVSNRSEAIGLALSKHLLKA